MSAFYLVTLFSCPDPSFRPQLVGAPCKAVFIPTQQGLAQPLMVVRRPHARPRHAMAAIRPGPQRLGCCSGGFISPASRPDAGSALGMAGAAPTTGSAPSPSSEPERIRDTGDTGVLATADDAPLPPDTLMGTARPMLSFAPTVQPPYGQTIWRLCQHRCCFPRISLVCRHHTSPLHCPASAMRPLARHRRRCCRYRNHHHCHCATNTKAQHSNGRSSQCTATTCPLECPCSHSCSNCAASLSQCANSILHVHMASALSLGTTCEPQNLPVLPSSAAGKVTVQCYKLGMEIAVMAG